VTGFFKDIGWQVNSSGGGGGGGGGGTTEAYYLSVGSAATVGGLAIQGSDIVRYSNGAATLLFRGSNVGLSGTRLDGFQVLPNGQILMSFATAVTLPVLGAVDAADIVTFTPTGSGANTAGSFAMFFDASDVGLSGSAENTDAFFYDAVAKKLYLSTSGSFTVAGLSGTSRDILSCNNLQSGWTTRCNGGFSLVFRGSNIGLTTTSENVDAFSIGPNGTLYFSTAGNYSLTVGGLSGPGGDVFSCASPVLGSNSSCGSVAKLLSASTLGLGTTSVTGFQFAP
jgi:hypothetical protein